MKAVQLAPPSFDAPVDDTLRQCVTPGTQRSFFLSAGAGSGKTRSLVQAIVALQENHRAHFVQRGERVAIVTYTNAACDEIISRTRRDSLFHISTIHSFCWSLIEALHFDIQQWLNSELPREIDELRAQQAKGRAGTKAALDRERGIEARTKRLEFLGSPRRFTYNPNGDNFGRSSLSHSEVLKIAAAFIATKPSMQELIAQRFPVIFVDEVQDTNGALIDALLRLENSKKGRLTLGFFGDTMQRIYFDGKEELADAIPADWLRLIKRMNHRSARRIVQLANVLRHPIDQQEQFAREDSALGTVRLFIASANSADKPAIERTARARMAELSNDGKWTAKGEVVKMLTLEHHMAAARMGFLDLFATLDKDTRNGTGLRSGQLSGLRFFTHLVSPLVEGEPCNDPLSTMELLRKSSPLLRKDSISLESEGGPLGPIRAALNQLQSLRISDPGTTFREVLKCVSKTGLFEIPNVLKPFASVDPEVGPEAPAEEDESMLSKQLEAWREFLETPYMQTRQYSHYVSNKAEFGTHHGVKGLEFDRVLMIMDDSSARGFQFSYEKLFGVADVAKKRKDAIDESDKRTLHTRRLLYVTCTRARTGLALIAYSAAPNRIRESAIANGWFEDSEVEFV